MHSLAPRVSTDGFATAAYITPGLLLILRSQDDVMQIVYHLDNLLDVCGGCKRDVVLHHTSLEPRRGRRGRLSVCHRFLYDQRFQVVCALFPYVPNLHISREV